MTRHRTQNAAVNAQPSLSARKKRKNYKAFAAPPMRCRLFRLYKYLWLNFSNQTATNCQNWLCITTCYTFIAKNLAE